MPTRDLRILDIGCANGGLLSALHALGYRDLTGIDPSPTCARNVSAREGIIGITGTFSALPDIEKKFDLIILTGVMEHLRDLATSIRGFSDLLAPGGHVYLAVPDAARYHAYIQAPLQDFNTEHINHFSMTTLGNLMKRHGYAVVTTGQQLSRESTAMDTPIIFGLYQYTGVNEPFLHEEKLADELRLYIEESRVLMDKMEAQFLSYLRTHKALIIWGTGQLTFKMLALAGEHGSSIAAFVDGNPINHGRMLMGKPILSPHQVSSRHEPILIMTTLHQAPITHTIRAVMKLPNDILTFAV